MYVLNPSFFTLNIPNSFRRSADKDQFLASTASRALSTLQVAFGIIPQVLAFGKDSCATMELLLSARRELEESERNRTGTNQISTLIMLDRRVDLISPLLTPTTYNALLDAKLDAKWNKVTLKSEDKNEKDKTIHLSYDVGNSACIRGYISYLPRMHFSKRLAICT